jgi:RNA polymerase primary sigma factor
VETKIDDYEETQTEVDEDYPGSLIEADDVISLYLKDVAGATLLTAEEEVALFKRMESGRRAQRTIDRGGITDPDEWARATTAVEDGLAARDTLIRSNSGLVISMAKRYAGRGVPFLDLAQEGYLGLIRAIDKFDYHRGNKLSTYATYWIRQKITRAAMEKSRIIRVPVHKGGEVSRLVHTSQRLAQTLGREPTDEELAAEAEMSVDDVTQLLRLARPVLSLEEPLDGLEDTELGDILEDTDSVPPDELAEEATLRELLTDILHRLPALEVRVLKLRYGLVDGETLSLTQLGKRLGVSGERVRQIEARALSRLRHPANVRRLSAFA